MFRWRRDDGCEDLYRLTRRIAREARRQSRRGVRVSIGHGVVLRDAENALLELERFRQDCESLDVVMRAVIAAAAIGGGV